MSDPSKEGIRQNICHKFLIENVRIDYFVHNWKRLWRQCNAKELIKIYISTHIMYFIMYYRRLYN